MSMQKMKMTDDFKKIVKGGFSGFLGAVVGYAVIRLVKGDFAWSELLLCIGVGLAVTILLLLFYYAGSRVPGTKE